jgi:hypothetical protein
MAAQGLTIKLSTALISERREILLKEKAQYG